MSRTFGYSDRHAAPPDGYGIAVTPGTPFNLYVTDTIITNNGTSGGGINVAPISGGSARVTLRHVQLDDNYNGLNVDTTASSATTRVIVSDSSMTGNSNNGINLSHLRTRRHDRRAKCSVQQPSRHQVLGGKRDRQNHQLDHHR